MKKGMVNFSQFLTLFALLLILPARVHGQQNTPVVALKGFTSTDVVKAGGELKLGVKVTVAEGWHINSNKPKDDLLVPSELSLAARTGFQAGTIVYPQAKEIKLGFQDAPLVVFEGSSYAGMIVKVAESVQPGEYWLKYTWSYQACNNKSCDAPTDVSDSVLVTVAAAAQAVKEINQDVFSNISFTAATQTVSGKTGNEESDSMFMKLEKNSLWIGLLIVFFVGLALNLTPCVYPLIPITIGFFGGQSEGRTSRLAIMGLLYMIGIAITYSVVGVVTALSGAMFGALLQNPFVIIFVVLVLLGLSLSMFGYYDIRMPNFLVEKAGDAKSGYYGAFFMGLTMGIVAAPCIGPLVLGLVAYVAAKADPLRGFLLFFVLALGLGTPYFVLALFSGKIKKLPRSGVWMDSVKHIFGMILIGMALYFALPLLPKTIAGYVLPVFMLITAVYLVFFEKDGNNLKGFRVFKIVFSVVLFALGVYGVIPQKEHNLEWQKYTETEFQAAVGKKPVIIDFYADWCIPCKELDKMTFSNEQVITEGKRFAAFKGDLTKSASPEVEAVKKKFNIIGVPTVIILDAQGKEVTRVTGFMPAEKFLPLMQQAK